MHVQSYCFAHYISVLRIAYFLFFVPITVAVVVS